MSSVIIFKLNEEEYKHIADLIKEKETVAEKECKKEINQPKYLYFKAKRTPLNVNSRIEIMLRRDMNNIIHVYKHLVIENENTGLNIHKLLYPKHLKDNMLKNMMPTDNLPYKILFKVV